MAGVVRRAQIRATTMLIQSLVHVARGPVARCGLQTELFFICSTSQQKRFFCHPLTPFISSLDNEEEHLNAFLHIAEVNHLNSVDCNHTMNELGDHKRAG